MATVPMKAEPAVAPAVVIMAKAPVAGLAKTRLIPLLGAQGAAELQAWLLQRTMATALAAGLGPLRLWCAPDTTHPAFGAAGQGRPLTLHRQADGDLGQRMLLAATASMTPAGILLIGTDCPALTSSHLQQAAAALRTHDATLIPAEDGGYVLLGLRRAAADVFTGIDWGSERVLMQTRLRLRTLGWRWQEQAELWDIDRPEDYARLQALLATAG